MGTKFSKEDTIVLSMWKLVLQKCGTTLDGLRLGSMVLRAKRHGVETSTVTALSVLTCDNLGSTLSEAVMKEDKEASGHLATRGLLRGAVGVWITG